MADQTFPWRKTFILGFGFFGISIIWPLFNSLIPPMLEDLGLTATVIGFIMTWDNIINMFFQLRSISVEGAVLKVPVYEFTFARRRLALWRSLAGQSRRTNFDGARAIFPAP